jgi:uncharacterized membrane protein YfcA
MTSLSLLLVGAAVGVLSGMLGIGGGIVLVPALVLLFGLSQTEAQGTSLATIPFGAIIAAVIYNQSTPLRASMVVAVGTGFVVGALLGAKMLPHVPEAALRSGFGCLLLYLGLLFVFDLKPSHPVGLMLICVAILGGWVRRRFRSSPPTPQVPPHENDYYI